MSANANDDQPEPAPHDPSKPNVWDLVINDVIADMKERDQLGRKRYGTPLQPDNGRDPLVDAYQESLDQTAYLKQEILQRARVVRTGVSAFVVRRSDGRFLVGERRGSHGAGTLALPGGNVEYGERLVDAARREVREEAKIEIETIKFAGFSEAVFEQDKKHYVTIVFVAFTSATDAVLAEPKKCARWMWVTEEELRARQEPLFPPLADFLDKLPVGGLQKLLHRDATPA